MEVIDAIVTGAVMTRDGILSVPGALLLASYFTTLSIFFFNISKRELFRERILHRDRDKDACEGIYPHSSRVIE